jgi:hypothetical protein
VTEAFLREARQFGCYTPEETPSSASSEAGFQMSFGAIFPLPGERQQKAEPALPLEECFGSETARLQTTSSETFSEKFALPER